MSQPAASSPSFAPDTAQELADALLSTGYLPDDGLATVAWLVRSGYDVSYGAVSDFERQGSAVAGRREPARRPRGAWPRGG